MELETKRNCGRTGPTTPEGRAISSQNALKHGACSKTLILPNESHEEWLLLLDRWCQKYQPEENSLEFDFVLKVAQAEWRRLRNQRHYDEFLETLAAAAPYSWSEWEIKTHDLLLRYKNSAERAFQRDYRLLEQHYKIHRPIKPKNPDFDPTMIPKLVFTGPNGERIECGYDEPEEEEDPQDAEAPTPFWLRSG